MKLIKLSENTFVLKMDNTHLVGDKIDVADYMIEKVGVLPSELAAAFHEFEKSTDNVAEFGINLTFIYTKRVELDKVDPMLTIKEMAA